ACGYHTIAGAGNVSDELTSRTRLDIQRRNRRTRRTKTVFSAGSASSALIVVVTAERNVHLAASGAQRNRVRVVVRGARRPGDVGVAEEARNPASGPALCVPGILCVLRVDHPVLHDERHTTCRTDVSGRIAVECDEVGEEPRFHLTDLVLH